MKRYVVHGYVDNGKRVESFIKVFKKGKKAVKYLNKKESKLLFDEKDYYIFIDVIK